MERRFFVGASTTLLMLGACSTAPTPPPVPIYTHVPCGTPGARAEVPIDLNGSAATQGSAATTPVKEKPTRQSAKCVIETGR